jgi:hypothetical protein
MFATNKKPSEEINSRFAVNKKSEENPFDVFGKVIKRESKTDLG